MFCVSVLVIVLLMSFKNYKNIKIMNDLILQIVKDPDLSYKETMAVLYFVSMLALYTGIYLYALSRKETKDDLPVISQDTPYN